MGNVMKARFWTGVLYLENMIEDWEMEIGDVVQVPYSYCIHNLDVDGNSEHRKDHVHIILAFPNTTTYKHAFGVFDLLSAEGKHALNKIEAVISIRSAYEYLIHNTETCKKKGKYLYEPVCRKSGNCFDIGAYEQLSMSEKNDMCKELCNVIVENSFTNFADFYMYVVENFEDTNYFEILKTYSGLFERLTKGIYMKHMNN